MFGSRTLAHHLIRGGTAAAFIALAIAVASAQPLVSLAAIVGAVIVMRGCPLCWVIGLIETIANRTNMGGLG
jgi:hypothetical protein